MQSAKLLVLLVHTAHVATVQTVTEAIGEQFAGGLYLRIGQHVNVTVCNGM